MKIVLDTNCLLPAIDKHFNILKEMNFPYIKVVGIEAFKKVLFI